MRYRAEIDGLRAIAVLSIILYHAEIIILGRNWFEGGFIGVDIFFVISGYLITRIILSEIFEKGSFSFLTFYERRARRILPMLFTVILVSVPFAWNILLPADFVEYSQSILSAIFFASNFFFYFIATEYGAASALLKPFLHTWSLGIEEQFYIIFPVLLMICFTFFRRYLLIILFVMILLSLQFANVMDGRDAEFNFYLPFSRFWELLVGSVLAYVELKHGRLQKRIWSNILPIIGLCLIAYSIVYFNSQTPHPSFETLIPVIGVALIIAFASTESWVGKLLASKIFVGVGLISYSAYLWHYPIFALHRYAYNHFEFDAAIEKIALVFVLSIGSYFLIERPFRNRAVFSTKSFLLSIIIAFTAISILSMLIKDRVIVNERLQGIEWLLDNAYYKNENKNFEINFDYAVQHNSKKNILIAGNSYAEDLLKALRFSKHITSRFNLNLTSPIKRTRDMNYQISCLYDFVKDGYTGCKGRNFTNHLAAQYNSADVIILASRWTKDDIKVLPSLVEKLVEDGKKVVIVSNAPPSKLKGRRQFNRFDRFVFKHKRLPNADELRVLEKRFYKYAQLKRNQRLRSVAHSLSSEHVIFVDRYNLMCVAEEHRCSFYVNDSKILWDYGHITTEGAQILGERIDALHWLGALYDEAIPTLNILQEQ